MKNEGVATARHFYGCFGPKRITSRQTKPVYNVTESRALLSWNANQRRLLMATLSSVIILFFFVAAYISFAVFNDRHCFLGTRLCVYME